jgi:hypothetical protein
MGAQATPSAHPMQSGSSKARSRAGSRRQDMRRDEGHGNTHYEVEKRGLGVLFLLETRPLLGGIFALARFAVPLPGAHATGTDNGVFGPRMPGVAGWPFSILPHLLNVLVVCVKGFAYRLYSPGTHQRQYGAHDACGIHAVSLPTIVDAPVALAVLKDIAGFKGLLQPIKWLTILLNGGHKELSLRVLPALPLVPSEATFTFEESGGPDDGGFVHSLILHEQLNTNNLALRRTTWRKGNKTG